MENTNEVETVEEVEVAVVEVEWQEVNTDQDFVDFHTMRNPEF